MREIIEIDKDFNLNTVKHSKKVKPSSKIKGKVNISLYDNNNLVRDIHTENLIMDWFKDETYERGFVDLIGRNTFKNSNFSVSPFSYLILSDQDIEEDSKNPFILKNTIGYVQRKTNYSGSDTLKGTYNSEESKTYIDEEGNLVCHEVYDFPTHACNGTINSLMWCPNYKDSPVEIFKISSSNSNMLGEIGHYDSSLNIVYTQPFTYEFKKIDFSNSSIEPLGYLKSPTNENIMPSNIAGYPYVDIENKLIRGGFCNYSSNISCGVPANSFLFGEWDLETLEIKDYKIHSIDSLKVNIDGVTYVTDLCSIHDKQYIYYLIYRETNKAYKGIVKANYEDGSLVSYYLFEKPFSTTYMTMLMQESNNSFRVYETNSKIDYVFDMDLNIKNIYSPIRDYKPITDYNNSYIKYSSASRTYSLYLISPPASSYVKLAQPVTKTNTNTMKVQYDFVIENPNVITKLMRK